MVRSLASPAAETQQLVASMVMSARFDPHTEIGQNVALCDDGVEDAQA